MWLSALYIWGCLLAFSACDSCPEPEDAASWLRLKPLGNCEGEENFCPYRITLPPLSIQLPKPFRELEKMAKELQNLKEVVNRLRRDCQECKDRQRVERGGWKDHVEDEERRTQRHNISSTERHNPNGEQMVRIVISTPPQEDTKEINHSSLERQGWDNDRRSDADQVTSSEIIREVKIFDPSFEETPEDIYEVKQTFLPITEDIHRERKIQHGEFFESSIPRRNYIVQSVTHGSEMSREVKIFNPSLGETPDDISEEKQVFSPTTEERQRERTFQEGELLESSIPRTNDFVQSSTHGKQQPNLFRERNVKNISGILAARRRVQNMTDINGLNTNSGDANTETVDLSISAGTRRIVNFSRAGGPLRPKTFINSRAKVSDEDRLRNPAAVRMHLQGGDRTVKNGPIGTGFSPVRSGVMRVKETSPHIINSKLGTKNGLTLPNHDEKITTNPKPGTNIGITPSNEDENIQIINPKPGTNSRLTTSPEDKNMAIINPIPDNPNNGIKIGQIISAEDEKLTTTSPKPGTNSRLTPSTDKKMTIINPKLGTNSRLNPSTEDENIAIVNPKPGTNSRLTLSINEKIPIRTPKPVTNSRLTPSTDDENMAIINPNHGIKSGQIISTDDGKTTITNPKPGTNSRLTSSSDDGKMTINPKLGTNSRLTPSTYGRRMTTTNPKPGTNSRLTPSTHAEKMANKEYTNTDSDLRTDSKNDLKDARQVTVDEEENFRNLNKTVITRVPTNMRTEDRGDVSHTVQTTNKSIFSVMNRDEQPNLIKLENEHMGRNASLVTSSTAGTGPSAGEADSTFPGRQVDEENYLVKETETGNGQEDLGSPILDTSNERETNSLTSDHKNETQLGTFIEEANEEKSTGNVKKDLLLNRKVTQLETDLVNPTLVPSVKITSADRKVSTAGKIESPVAGQGTRIIKPGSISQPVKLEENVENIQSINSKKNISKIREASNVRFVKNITRVMPKLPIRPGRHPTTVIPSGGSKLHMINKGNSSVVLPSNSSISGRNSNFGRRNSSVMMKPSYIRRRPSFQTEPNTSRGFKANVSTVTHFMTPTGEISTDHTEETKVNTQAMGSHVIDKNTSTVSKSLPAGEVQDPVGGQGSESALTSKVVSGTEDSNIENSLHTGASDSLTGGKESKQFGLETTGQHPLQADSMKSLLNPQNPQPTPSTQSSSVNEKTQPTTSNNARVPFTVTDHEESTKHIPAVTNKHEDMVKNISQDTASTPVSFENTEATRELELIELNEDKVQKYSGDVLSNPNSVNDVRGNNGERYTIPVVLETLANVKEIKGSKVFSLSPEDTADGFKTIAVRDEVTQKEQAENKIQSTCVGDCNTTPTQQPTTQSRPPFESERGRGLPQDCADYITKARKNAVYRVTPRSKNTTFHLSCDMETSGGGWTLIQQRFNGNISFNRTWDEYKRGFGKLMGEFWLGNDKINWLTQAKNMSLRIELEDFEGVREYAHYDHFHVANESQQYRLSIGGYSGTAGDAMQFNKKYNHDQKLFTTPDRDNDLYPSGNCGAYYSSGWWFDACMSANLNGKYYHTKYKGVRNGIFWGTWHNITMEYYPTNERQSFKTVRMMIRPQNYAN